MCVLPDFLPHPHSHTNVKWEKHFLEKNTIFFLFSLFDFFFKKEETILDFFSILEKLGIFFLIRKFNFGFFSKKLAGYFVKLSIAIASHPHPVNTPHARTSHAQSQRGFAPLSHLNYRTHMCYRTFVRTHTNILPQPTTTYWCAETAIWEILIILMYIFTFDY